MSLVGRHQERDRLDALVAASRVGESGCIQLVGEAGIGKSALLEWMREQTDRMSVLTVCGVESERELPYAALGRLLQPILGQIDALRPLRAAALRSALALEAGSPAERFTTYAATLDLLGAAAADHGLVVLIDDAHLLDAPSRDALLFVARRLDCEGVVIVLAGRHQDGHPADDLPELHLSGLADDEARSLVAEASAAPVAPTIDQELAKATNGNPLALKECAARLSPAQLAGQEPLPSPLPAGPQLEHAFGEALAELPEATRRALLVAAADTGEIATVSQALETSGLRVEDLEPAESAGIITIAEGRVAFDHPLRRSAAYHSAAAARRREAHLALAHALPAELVPARAWHLALGTTGDDADVADLLEAAATDARKRGAYGPAASAVERAGKMTPPGDGRAARLMAAAMDYTMAGNLDRAAAALEEAQTLACSPELKRSIALMTTRGRMMRGAPGLAADELANEADRIAADDPSGAAALLSEAAMALLLAGAPADSLAYAERSVALATTVGGDPLEHARLAVAVGRVFTGERDGATLLLESMPFLDANLGPERAQLTLTFGALPLTWIDQTDAARRLLEPAIAQARAQAPGLLPLALPIQAMVELRCGRPLAALAAASEAVELAEDMAASTYLCFALTVLVAVKTITADQDDVRATAAHALDLIRVLDKSMGPFVTSSLGCLELSVGRPERALTHLAPIADAPELATVGEPGFLRWRHDWIEALVRTGRADEAEAALAGLDEQARRTQRRSAQAAAARCRGLLDDDFSRHFDEAIGLFKGLGDAIEEGRTALCYGERLRQLNRRTEARAQLRSALEIFDRVGAVRWWTRTRHELRVAGERVAERALTGREQLTPRELQVALAVAGGATNSEAAAALFLSIRTVDTHLTRIYRKLGVRSRTQLANALRS